jgi:hypothetical protein
VPLNAVFGRHSLEATRQQPPGREEQSLTELQLHIESMHTEPEAADVQSPFDTQPHPSYDCGGHAVPKALPAQLKHVPPTAEQAEGPSAMHVPPLQQ